MLWLRLNDVLFKYRLAVRGHEGGDGRMQGVRERRHALGPSGPALTAVVVSRGAGGGGGAGGRDMEASAARRAEAAAGADGIADWAAAEMS